jgi:hypothetical protein
MTLSEKDTLLLNSFTERIRDLRCSTIANAEPVDLTVNIAFGSTGAPIPAFQGHNHDAFCAFLLILRQFSLHRDAPNFFNVCNVVFQQCPDPCLRAWSIYSRKLWKDTLNKNPLSYEIGKKKITVDVALDIFINSHLFHTNYEKNKLFTQISPGGQATIRRMRTSCAVGLGCFRRELLVIEVLLHKRTERPAVVLDWTT